MEPTIEELRTTYLRLGDEELTKLATEEASGLRKEAQEALIDEMAKRNFPEEVLKGMYLQVLPLNDESILSIIGIIRSQPCPHCGNTNKRLNATITATVYSVIFFSQTDKRLVIACPTCLDKSIQKANLFTGLLGWWAFPSGMYAPIHAFLHNGHEKKKNHQNEPTEHLLLYAKQNLGKIQALESKPQSLVLVLRNAELKESK